MGREFIDGFESKDLNLWDYSVGTGFSTALSNAGGTVSLVLVNDGYAFKQVTARSAYYAAIKWTGNGGIFKFSNDTTILGTLRVKYGTNYLAIYRGDENTLLATGTTIVVPGIPYLIEVYYVPATDTTGSFIVKINGIVDITVTAAQTSNDALQINRIWIGGKYNNTFDDFVLDSANWIGNTKIQGIVPTAAGNSTNWTPSTGSNYACVDEIPPSDTDYISTNVADTIDTYTAGDLTGSPAAIKSVQLQARVQYQGTPAVLNAALVVRTASTDYPSADKTVTTGWKPITNIWETNPNTAVAWTPSDINGIEIGIKARA